MDTVAGFRRLSFQAENELFSRLQNTLATRESATSLSWIDVYIREMVLAGAEYQRKNLPRHLRPFGQIDMRTENIDRFVRRRVSDLLDRPNMIADADSSLRPRLIALGEVNAALFFGRHELINQMITRGALRSDWIYRQWKTKRDEKVRNSHEPLHNQIRPWGVPFSSPFSGNTLMHPHDRNAPISEVANCRCSELIFVSLPQ